MFFFYMFDLKLGQDKNYSANLSVLSFPDLYFDTNILSTTEIGKINNDEVISTVKSKSISCNAISKKSPE